MRIFNKFLINLSCLDFIVPLHLEKLPFSIRVLLESVVRNCDGFQVLEKDVNTIINWSETQHDSVEFPFRPARTILQDFTLVSRFFFHMHREPLLNCGKF